MTPSILRGIAPFEFEVGVGVDFEGCEVAVFVVEDANCEPIASAAALKVEKDSLLPSGLGLIANTIPWPQWLDTVFAA